MGSDKSDINNYRPYSLLIIFEHAIQIKFSSYLD